MRKVKKCLNPWGSRGQRKSGIVIILLRIDKFQFVFVKKSSEIEKEERAARLVPLFTSLRSSPQGRAFFYSDKPHFVIAIQHAPTPLQWVPSHGMSPKGRQVRCGGVEGRRCPVIARSVSTRRSLLSSPVPRPYSPEWRISAQATIPARFRRNVLSKTRPREAVAFWFYESYGLPKPVTSLTGFAMNVFDDLVRCLQHERDVVL